MTDDKIHKLLTFVRKLSLPKENINRLYFMRNLTEENGETAEDIFVNGTDFMEASIAVEARELLKEVGDE